MITLEHEFEEYKAIHKYSVLKAKLIDYYRTLEQDKILVPDFQRQHETPEALADKDIRMLILRPNGLQLFNHYYELAYKDLAEVLD